MTGFLLFFGWIALRVRTFDRSFELILPAWTEIPGVAFMAVGGVIVLSCAGVFVARGRGTPAVFDPPQRFVALGPYKYVRNPMYIGGLLLLAGFGLYHHSVSILLMSLLILLILHLFVVLYEESDLRNRFGRPYEEYCRAVPRWIPGARDPERNG